MKILVTGHKGFIGRHLKEELERIGHDVVGFDIGDKLPSKPVDLVYHLASKVDAYHSVEEPLEGLENIKLTYMILEWMRETESHYLVFASSREVYSLYNPYGVSKKCSEKIIKVYCQLYPMSAVSARIANVFGVGNLSHRFIESTIDKVKNNEDIIIYGGDSKIVNFVYIDDCVDKLVQFGNYLTSNSCGCVHLDIASNRSWRLTDITRVIIEEIGDYKGRVVNTAGRRGETMCYIPKKFDLLIPDSIERRIRELCSLL